ncbi:hypothetical protein L596_004683 [Steinernema carpocapsae]|uniref:Uncharacterized protein n=1 Tax=Steinernema carpocapsae TaxID=34508 RepID=A0A4U8UWJ7_STECR|nr:hypothetical protein L596_004683 [Steinernema carpocapsae]
MREQLETCSALFQRLLCLSPSIIVNSIIHYAIVDQSALSLQLMYECLPVHVFCIVSSKNLLCAEKSVFQ